MSMTVAQHVAGGAGVEAAVEAFMEGVVAQSPGEVEFHQAVHEVARSVMPVIQANPDYRQARILERLVVPDTVIMFRVVWADDSGQVHVNRGYRVRMSSLIGPYKGGLRFHPSVNLGVLKFLAFEQIFKNSLTTLLLGGGQRGLGLRSEGTFRRRDHAILPSLHVQPVPLHRSRYGRAGR